MVLAGFELTTSRSEDRRSSNWANRAAVEENFCNREKQNEDEHMSLAQTFLRHDLMMKPGLEPRYNEGPRDC